MGGWTVDAGRQVLGICASPGHQALQICASVIFFPRGCGLRVIRILASPALNFGVRDAGTHLNGNAGRNTIICGLCYDIPPESLFNVGLKSDWLYRRFIDSLTIERAVHVRELQALLRYLHLQ
jgi:hypothetical protein